MTEQQKTDFCDNYCKHLADSNYRLEYLGDMLSLTDYCVLCEKEQKIMAEICKNCPLNEVVTMNIKNRKEKR